MQQEFCRWDSMEGMRQALGIGWLVFLLFSLWEGANLFSFLIQKRLEPNAPLQIELAGQLSSTV